MTAPRILLTGFEPFDEWAVNSSWEGARLAAERIGGDLALRLLPVDHAAAARALDAALDESQPDIALLCGLAEGESFRLELRARRPSIDDAPQGGDSWRGVWPWRESLARLRADAGPTRFSKDCGRYVCETAYWRLLERRSDQGWPRLAAFLHTPPLSGDWTAERIADGVAAALGEARCALS